VEPSNPIRLAAGASQVITVTATVGPNYNDWEFGEVRFAGDGQTLHLTVAARSVSGLAPRAVEIETRRNQGLGG